MNSTQLFAEVSTGQMSPLVLGVLVLAAIVALVIAIKIAIFIVRFFFVLLFLALAAGAVWYFLGPH
jgi:hypothetical protein